MSRTFGDIEAKLTNLGGNPNVIVAEPDIKHFEITSNFDFLYLGCDGIFDRLSNREVVDTIWETSILSNRDTIH